MFEEVNNVGFLDINLSNLNNNQGKVENHNILEIICFYALSRLIGSKLLSNRM